MTTLLLPAFELEPSTSSVPPNPNTAFRINSTRQSAVRRHCNDPECYIWVAAVPESQRWASFDAFDPAEIDDYGRSCEGLGERANALKKRAKARLMPRPEPYLRAPSTSRHASTRRRAQPLREASPCPVTPTRARSPLMLRTPSPMVVAPRTPPAFVNRYSLQQSWPSINDQSELQSTPPRTPRRQRKISSNGMDIEPTTPRTIVVSSPTPRAECRVLSPSPIKKYGR